MPHITIRPSLLLLAFSFSVQAATFASFFDLNLATVQAIYDSTIYPGNKVFKTNASVSLNLANYFSDDVVGRVSPIGNFTDLALATEYFYGLAPDPDSIRNPAKAGIAEAKITSFTSSCPNIAASSVNLIIRKFNGSEPGEYVSTLVQTGFWRFDGAGKVVAFDLVIPNLQEWIEATILPPGASENSAVQSATIQYICSSQATLCTGKNQVYRDAATCIERLEAKKFGSYHDTWQDSVTCRSIHVELATLRPDLHCPDIGPTGGSACVDARYDEKYGAAASLSLFGSDTPFLCPSPSRPGPNGGRQGGGGVIVDADGDVIGTIPRTDSSGVSGSGRA